MERPDRADMIEPTDAAEPMENADMAEPMEPTERMDPTEPIDRIEPLQPMHRIESCDLMDHRDREPVVVMRQMVAYPSDDRTSTSIGGLTVGGAMRISVPLLGAAALIATVVAACGAAAATTPANTLNAGYSLSAGHSLRSGDGAYATTMYADGVLRIAHHGRTFWSSGTRAPGARLVLKRDGNLVIVRGTSTVWATGTSGSGFANRLVMANNGSLMLFSAHGLVWSTRLPNGCRSSTSAKRLIVYVNQQLARMCAGQQQILTTPLTSGASSLGYATPLGTWHVQAKQRDTYLYPAAGGRYFVHYWVPYDGVYGVHDSSWQSFAYGSSVYRTQGSHGCVHLPGSVMAWFFQWVTVGTTVTVTA